MKEAFAPVVNAYYREGLNKIDLVCKLLEEKDIRNYVVEVHALKSSSAAIGADAMSALFRELEFAGKADNLEYIESHTMPTIDSFREVLDVVKGYLVENNIFEDDSPEMPQGDVEEFDDSVIDQIVSDLSNFNIKASEDKVKECAAVNYGDDINETFREVKKCLEIFDYHKAKDLLVDLKRRRDESGI